ncbi:MAG: uracil-DNA glycosylase [Deltaproteobacteria bacterium]|uniref:Type-4 uracil-DNA glycosylase n=1 Tax=Candidatus Zymogenus saltonus TaxID=2844893 RepID=A0A9D8PNL0_9DELT|nr:uracil-DNA glycosylase [Candidatus Zymogenus saltonus]
MAGEEEREKLVREAVSALQYLKALGCDYIPDGPGIRALFGEGAQMVEARERMKEVVAEEKVVVETVGEPTAATATSLQSLNLEGERPSVTLEEIRERLGDCARCKLSSGRQNIVFGDGNPNAVLMFVGEGPGKDEDIQGIPFVGRAGQLLTKIIEAIDMKREDVYIANIVKCRPPENRVPEPDEVKACIPFLMDQIEAIRPQIIVTLGGVATNNLLGTKGSLGSARGRFHTLDHFGSLVMPTYHPAYLLRDPAKKRETWEDMKKVRDMYNTLMKGE